MLLRPLLTVMFLGFMLGSCDSSTSSEPKAGASAGLRGSVLLQDGKGLAGARVRLHSTGAVTATAADGTWSFPGTAFAVGARAVAGTDSITVSKDSQVIASQAVTSSELPPLYVVQRDIFGALGNLLDGSMYAISAKLTLPDGTVRALPLERPGNTSTYSGFIYTVAGTGAQNFAVQVHVRGSSDTSIIGVSPVVTFTSAAGDIQIPGFGVGNVGYKLVLAAPSDSIAFKSTFAVSASVSDTTLAGIGLHAPYQYSYAVGSGPWVSGRPTSVVLDTSLVRSPVIKVKVSDATGGVLLDSVPVVVRARVSRTYIWVRPTYVSAYDSVLKQYIVKSNERPTTTGHDTTFWKRYDTYGFLRYEHGWSSVLDSAANPGSFTTDNIGLVFNTDFDDTASISISHNGVIQSLAPLRASVRFTPSTDTGVAYLVVLRCDGTYTDDLGVRHGPGLVRIFGRKSIEPVGIVGSVSATKRSVQLEGKFSGSLTFLGAFSL